MRLRRPVLLAAAVVLCAAVPAHAGATTFRHGTGTFVIGAGGVDLATQTQRFTATVSIRGHGLGYVTYHAVATHTPDLSRECGADLAGDRGHLLAGSATKPSGAATVPFGTYVFCAYHDTAGTGAPRDAVIIGSSSGGSFIVGAHPGVGKVSIINLFVRHVGKQAYTVDGAINGPRSGTVRVQRLTGAGWRTIAIARLANGVYRTQVILHRGDQLRAYYAGTSAWRSDVSPVATVR